MKRNIFRTIGRALAAAVVAAGLFGCSDLAGTGDEGSASRGGAVASVFIPDYDALAEQVSGARAVAPQTASVRLSSTATPAAFSAVSQALSEGTRTEGENSAGVAGYSYTFTFRIPVGEYEAGSLKVETLDSDGSTLTSGVSASAVTVGETSASAAFTLVPSAAAASYSGALGAGEMQFITVTVPAGSAYEVAATDGVTLFLFDESGKYSSTLTGTEIANDTEEDATYYIGIYNAGESAIESCSVTASEVVYSVVYGGETLAELTEPQLAKYSLTETTDYTADTDSKTVTLTVSGYVKVFGVDTITSSTKISFGEDGNYSTLTTLDTSSATVRDNGTNNSQIAGSISFKVLSGAIITVSSYSGYTSYTLSDGTTTSDTQTGTSYSYVAAADSTITLATVASTGGNYLYSIAVQYPISENTLLDLRTLLSSCSTGGASSTGENGDVTYSSMYYKDSQHGAWFYKTSALSFIVGGASKIYLAYDSNSATSFVVSATTATGSAIDSSSFSATTVSNVGTTPDATTTEFDSTNAASFIYAGEDTAVITLSLSDTSSGQAFLPAIYVSFDKVAATAVEITGEATVAAGSTTTLTATLTPSDSTDIVTWSSSDTDVATVDSTGVVTGVAAGSATITATANDSVSGEYKITVTEAAETTYTVYYDSNTAITDELSATDFTAYATSYSLTETTDYTISGSTVTLTTTGCTKVRSSLVSTYELTGESASLDIYKSDILKNGYLAASVDKWNNTYYNMATDRTLSIKVKGVLGFDLYIKDSNGSRDFTVKIGDNDAVTVTTKGKITVNGSSTDVIGYTFNTGSTDETTIVVTGAGSSIYPDHIVLYNEAQTIAAESVTISGAPEDTVVLSSLSDDDKSVALTATVLPARATEKTVTWSSSDEKVATVTADESDSTKATLTYVAAGTATITAKVSDTVYAEAEITLQDANVVVTAISVTDSDNGASGTIDAGDTLTLTATVTPENATDSSVTWSSSNEEVATVADGVVTGVAAGSATITATAADGSGVTGTYSVTVNSTSTLTYYATVSSSSTSAPSASATASDSSALTGAAISWTTSWDSTSSADSVNKVTESTNKSGKMTVNGDFLQSASEVTVTDTVTYTFTATAVKDITLSKLSFVAGCGQTGNFNAAVSYKIGSGDSVALGKTVSGKGISFEESFGSNVTVSANSTVEVTIVLTQAKAAVWKSSIGDIVLTVK